MLFPTLAFGVFFLVVYFTAWSLDRENGKRKLFLLLASLVLTVNFQTVGGLMIYSLLANPAVAAARLVRGYGRMLIVAAGLGGVSGAGGFLISAWTDLPTGAMIVILSSCLVGLALAWERWRGKRTS